MSDYIMSTLNTGDLRGTESIRLFVRIPRLMIMNLNYIKKKKLYVIDSPGILIFVFQSENDILKHKRKRYLGEGRC